MNKDAIFINVGRGNVVVEEDIAEALNNNIIRGAALDVTKKDPSFNICLTKYWLKVD